MSIPQNHSTFSANSNVSAQDRSEAIDFENRLNCAFDHWRIAEMNDAFADNCLVEHPRGRVGGRAAIAKFLDAYKPLTVGIPPDLNQITEGFRCRRYRSMATAGH